ncbi:MAG TPA: CoA-binding protein [Anaerolineales bacterium]
MASKAEIDDFLAQEKIAVVGVSRDPNKFGTIVYRDLRSKGYRVFAVNPQATQIEADPCFPSLTALPEPVSAAVLVVPPGETEKVVQEAAQAGIQRVWMQPGAESLRAVAFCQENGITCIADLCVMMFARPVKFPHSAHRLIKKITGRLPK